MKRDTESAIDMHCLACCDAVDAFNANIEILQNTETAKECIIHCTILASMLSGPSCTGLDRLNLALQLHRVVRAYFTPRTQLTENLLAHPAQQAHQHNSHPLLQKFHGIFPLDILPKTLSTSARHRQEPGQYP